MIKNLVSDLVKVKNPQKAKLLSGYFKTGKGEYGEGDVFWGIMVPVARGIAKKYEDLALVDIQKLLKSKVHEQRSIALYILVSRYKQGDSVQKKEIFDFYLKNTGKINNWDLVDCSAPYILGDYLLNSDKKILYKLANSNNIWERRIAIISTLGFIKENKFDDTLKIAEKLLTDKHDLIHKAVGWALREVGKRNLEVEEKFLMLYYKKMPRTMLRYAIERFGSEKRRFYLS